LALDHDESTHYKCLSSDLQGDSIRLQKVRLDARAAPKAYAAVLDALFSLEIGSIDLALLVTEIRMLFGKRNRMFPQSLDGSGITDRLGRLEMENRRLKRLGLAALAVMGAALVMGQSSSRRTVEANEFILRDASGSIRATLKMNKGEPWLTLFGSNGKAQATLMSNAVEFADSNGIDRVILGSDAAASVRKVGDQNTVIDQGPGLLLSGPNGTARADLRGMTDGAVLSLYGQNQDRANAHLRVNLSSGVNGVGPSLAISDDQGFQAVVGSISLSIPSTGGSSRTSAASLVLFDKDGKVVWNVP
jgi:hypothetical protein